MSTSEVLQHLYSLDTSSPDLLRYLYHLIQNDDEDQYLSSLQGPELTRLVEFLDGALDVTPITDDVFRRCLNKLQAICSNHKILPYSYNISGYITLKTSDPVASGGFADVWEGNCNGKTVCIKRLRINHQNRETMEKAFYKEAVMWKRLRSRGIAGLIGVTRDPLQFVSEWMPNGNLMEYLDENPDANRIVLLLDLAEGVAFLHSLHITHGDLKGVNVLINHSDHACLADFGFTSVVRREQSVLVSHVQGYSSRWAAPEVLQDGDRYTREADVFAFGMIVIEVFTRRLPFDEFTTYVAVSKIIAGERPDRPQEPGLTDLVWEMTIGCWAQEPAQRHAMEHVVEILRECSRLSTPKLHLPTLTLPQQLVENSHNAARFMSSPTSPIPVDGRANPIQPQAQTSTPNNQRQAYSEPIVHPNLSPGQSLNQRPPLQLGSMDSPSRPSQSITAFENQPWNDLSTHPGHLAWNSLTSSPTSYVPHSSLAHLSPPLPQPNHSTTSVISRRSQNYLHSVLPPVSDQPGNPRIVGHRCSNCFGRGKTLGFFIGFGNTTCNVCGGSGRLH